MSDEVRKNIRIMATSSKDIETLWNCYSNEVNKQCISVAQFFESNGIPYHVFEKCYKKRMQPSSVVDCVVSGAPDDISPDFLIAYPKNLHQRV